MTAPQEPVAPAPEKKEKKKNRGLLLALIALLLIGAVGGGLLFGGKKTVTFDSDGGTPVAAVKVKKGETVARPADPEKSGYDFAGWQLNGQEYDFGQPVNDSITLKAKWNEAIYVVFVADGNEIAREHVVDGHVKFPEAPKLDGYAFVGWQDGGMAEIGEDHVFTKNTVLTANYKVYVPVASISFGQPGYEMERGSTLKPAVKAEPYNWVEGIGFSSSDDSVASVSPDGTITAHEAGTATITVHTESGKSATTEITVVVSCQSLSFNKSEISIKKGEKFHAELTVNPADTTDEVSFSTSDKSVAKVDADGNVTGVGYGTATITAKAGAQMATMKVKVENPATDISAPDDFNVYVGDVFYINAKVVPSDSTSKIVSYTTSDSSIAVVSSDGKVTAIEGGACYILVETDNGLARVVNIYVDKYTMNVSLTLPTGCTPYYLFYRPVDRPVIKVSAVLDVIHNGYHTSVPLTADELQMKGQDKVLVFYNNEIYATGYGTNGYGFQREYTKTVFFQCEYLGKLINSKGIELTVEPMLEISCPTSGCSYNAENKQLNLPAVAGSIDFRIIANLMATATGDSGAKVLSFSYPAMPASKPAYTYFDCQYYKTTSSSPGRIVIRTAGGQEIIVNVR